ncbi:MAG: 2OG-Fe(II) oxygenase [Sphingomonas bacterium]|nr:2OG-Fe(II) oxygenase [Sphingomonas bacterium]
MSLGDLERRAQSDGGAALSLAEARLMGDGGAPDAAAALALVEHAACLGNADARRAWVYMTAAGIGRAADPEAARAMLSELAKEDRFAAVQLAFLGHVTCRQRLPLIVPEIVSDDPRISLHRGLFSAAECRYLMLLGTPWLERALVVDEATGAGVIDAIRDADTSSFPPLAEDLVVQQINACVAAASGTKAAWGEPLTILRYQPGQQYRPHHDAHGAVPGALREWTALIWLNDDYAGGETDFPDVGVRVKGAVGDLLLFHNVTADGKPDARMIHAGLPVTSGVKWMASRWIRRKDYLG